jgi:hypothetical protein
VRHLELETLLQLSNHETDLASGVIRERWRLDLATEDDESLVRSIIPHGDRDYAVLGIVMSSPIGHNALWEGWWWMPGTSISIRALF